jgi:hypothetical protein
MSQLDYCRFLYYLIQNSEYIPLPEESLSRVLMILFKHLIKLIKQLADGRQNGFKLPNWDTFKQSPKWTTLLTTFQEYCEKYER